ncbi:MAG: hypothetical protein NVV83_17000 [Afipia sp.]|nr:hypothetical protein [Afipia sp.]
MGDGHAQDAMKAHYERVREVYDEAQHDPLSFPPDLDGLSDDDAIEEMREWFFENFENPVESTPFESAEGGYIYIWGGPYGTRDVVETVFSDFASENAIAELVEKLDRESPDWVPSSSRRQSPEEGDEEEILGAEEFHAQMLKRTSAIEQALSKVPEPPVGIGHNMPPELLEPVPLDENDVEEIKGVVSILKAQPLNPSDQGKSALEALTKLETKREKLAAWLLKQGEVFTTEAVKEAGKEFGKWAPRAFWFWLMIQLTGLSQAIGGWLDAIKESFF